MKLFAYEQLGKLDLSRVYPAIRPRLIMLMRVGVFYIIILTMGAQLLLAKDGRSQNMNTTYVELGVNGESLQSALKKIEQRTGFLFAYQQEQLTAYRHVTLSKEKRSVKATIDLLLRGTDLSYRQMDDNIIIFKEEDKEEDAKGVYTLLRNAMVRDSLIRGKITNEAGDPLEGATVMIQGTAKGITTDAKGIFSVKAARGQTLLFSMVGYKPRALKIGQQKELNITMSPAASDLNDVMVVGYGVVRKSDLTGSISRVKVENPAQQGINSYEQLLQGRSSGVNITQTSGAPGAGITFNIRGTNSLGSNQPLIVIDGYPVESDNSAVSPSGGSDYWTGQAPPVNALASLDPNEIESVEILKDASSTAIYGSRGANGVVMITTKKGREGKDRISYSFRGDVGKLPKQISVLGPVDFMKYANEARKNSGGVPVYTDSMINNYAGPDINWQDEIYQTSFSQDHQVSFTGGDKRTKYSVSGNYTTANGIVKLSDYDRGGIRINLDRQMTDRLKMGVNFNATMAKTRGAVQSTNINFIGASVVGGALRYNPLLTPFTDDGSFDITLQSNPVLTNENTDNESKINTLLTNIFAEYTLVKGLTFKVNGGFNRTTSLRQQYFKLGTFVGDNGHGQAYWGTTDNYNYLTEYTLNFNRQLGRHRINAVGGFSWQSWQAKTFGLIVTHFGNDNLSFNALQYGNTVGAPTTTLQNWSLGSYLSRINYSYDGKYLITLTGRYDGSSRLAAGHKWDFFPSAGVGWNMNQESFMSDISWISQLKVRASYGISGNQSIPVGSTESLLTAGRAAIGAGNIVTGVILSTFDNPNLKWETTRQFNAGVDVGFMDNKYSLTVDYYKKKTTNLLINANIPADNGFSTYATNMGAIQNQGVDIDASARLFSGSFKWTLSGNISFNRSKVLDVGPAGIIFGQSIMANGLGQNLTIARPGSSVGAFYGYKITGIYQNADEVSKGPKDPVNPAPGDLKYADISGPNGVPDGKITADDRVILGRPDPNYNFGISNAFSYKRFSLSILIYGSLGQSVANLNRYFSDGMVYAASGNIRTEAYQHRWTGEGTSNFYPRAKTTGTLVDTRFSNFLLEDGSFIRLKNINLAYDIPVTRIRFFHNLSVFVNATNLVTITKYKGYDPEISGISSNGLDRGIDYGTIPLYRTFSFGINAAF